MDAHQFEQLRNVLESFVWTDDGHQQISEIWSSAGSLASFCGIEGSLRLAATHAAECGMDDARLLTLLELFKPIPADRAALSLREAITTLDLLIARSRTPKEQAPVQNAEDVAGWTWQRVDKRMRDLLMEDPNRASLPQREWARQVGCKPGLVAKVLAKEFWQKVVNNTRHQRSPVPNTVSFRDSHESAVGELDVTLEDLVREQTDDYEPSPLRSGGQGVRMIKRF